MIAVWNAAITPMYIFMIHTTLYLVLVYCRGLFMCEELVAGGSFRVLVKV